MHHTAWCANYRSAVGLTDRLMTEAHAEQGNLGAVALNDRDADASIGRRTGAGAEDDGARVKAGDFVDGDCVISTYDWTCTELAKILDEVVGEGIVIVDDQEHT